MLYKHNREEKLWDEIFRSPGSEYRGAPFWAWNTALDSHILEKQMECFQEMGFGGFHMHVRTGLKTPYMGKEFMEAVRQCVEWAKTHGMKAYLYDEDRWPSGTASGQVTRERQFCGRCLRMSANRYPDTQDRRLLAVYDIEFDEHGCLRRYEKTGDTAKAGRVRRYAYVEIRKGADRFNGYPYVNTLDRKAIRRFLNLTHEKYAACVGEEFGDTIPAIFTDEPQFIRKQQLRTPEEEQDILLPWTDDLPDTFFREYGLNLLDGLPELLWELPPGQVSRIRYCYHDHVAERFAGAFADTCGIWCEEHDLMLTGHMMEEPTLESQTCALGEAIRSYRSFSLPGIDMLCYRYEYTTAKQCQSAVHQYGREGMLSELYGVTGWDASFCDYKMLGDWQAALGVTLRVPHLSWMSMEGEAKRDYPASIFYQSCWWREYKAVEDHFARLNTALTRGKPMVRVGVIHPVESYWLHWGPVRQTDGVRRELEQRFQNVTEWLLFGTIDFDFISEALLPGLCVDGTAPMAVGEMRYEAIVVPGCETLRSTTVERLEQFVETGGRLIFLGEPPEYVDALPSERGKRLFEKSLHTAAEKYPLLNLLEEVRQIEITDIDSGGMTDFLIHQIRRDSGGCWLMIAHGKKRDNPDICTGRRIRIRIKGYFRLVRYHTMTGDKEATSFWTDGGWTVTEAVLWDADSLLFYLEPVSEPAEYRIPVEKSTVSGVTVQIPETARYALSEPNVLLLDRAEYSLDGGEWQPEQEILRICQKVRKSLGWPLATDVQPYVFGEEERKHHVCLRLRIHCEQEIENPLLAAEQLEYAQVRLDGEEVTKQISGWYVDSCIRTMKLPALCKGEHILEYSCPLAVHTNLEWMYLLGEFAVRRYGRKCVLTALPGKIGYSSITEQGFPFYGGMIEYQIPIRSTGGGIRVHIPHWRGIVIKATVDNLEEKLIAYPPYTCDFMAAEGEHTLYIRLFGHRGNSFGPVHLADEQETWIGPGSWRTLGDRWSDEYRLKPIGLMSAPVVESFAAFRRSGEKISI